MQPSVKPIVSAYDDSRLFGLVIEDKKNFLRGVYYSPIHHAKKWQEYLDTAERSYARHGVACAVRRSDLEKSPCPSFWLIEDTRTAELVGGMRNHGPYTDVASVWALQEMQGHPLIGELESFVQSLLPMVVMETKGAFVCSDDDVRRAKNVTRMILRLQLLSIDIIGAGAMVATSAKHTVSLWESSGCKIICPHISVPYPNKNYSTVLMTHLTAERTETLNPQLQSTATEDLFFIRESLRTPEAV